MTKYIGIRRKVGNPVHNGCSFMMICDHLAGRNPLLIIKRGYLPSS